MTENRTIQLAEIPIGGEDGAVWNRLHGEREDICEALLKRSELTFETNQDLLQARLRKIDDALDRLMSGSYVKYNAAAESLEIISATLD